MTSLTRFRSLFPAAVAATAAVLAVPGGGAVGAQTPRNITAVPGVRVGHMTLTSRPTGCTVVLLPPNSVGGVDQRGGAPGTRETDVLRPDNSVEVVNAIVLSGGSVYGLDAATGVMKFLEEKRIGYPVGNNQVVPIVPAAILFDLGVGDHPEIRPDASCGYQAASRAVTGAIDEGSVGAGAGATVGKMGGAGRAMKGGIGSASFTMPDGLIVGAIVAVNAVGTVVDPLHGNAPVAGMRSTDGKSIENPFAFIRRGAAEAGRAAENTTIGVIVTNAKLTKAQAQRVALMAHDGMARAIVPSHTPSDGDTLFAVGTGSLTGNANVSQVGQLAAEAVTDAILRAVRLAKGLPGYPAASDIHPPATGPAIR